MCVEKRCIRLFLCCHALLQLASCHHGAQVRRTLNSQLQLPILFSFYGNRIHNNSRLFAQWCIARRAFNHYTHRACVLCAAAAAREVRFLGPGGYNSSFRATCANLCALYCRHLNYSIYV